ncbi:MAG: LamG domain-containing protein [Candidatus Marsarchaeota archaeon]|nr:LamG domain-containing protein [Candidatus Marsarchaeota archaeon]
MMLGGSRKGQIALEFLIVYSIVLLIFVIIFALVVNERAASLSSDEYQSLQLAVEDIAVHLDQALIAGNGYTATVPVPPVTSTNPYKLFISTSGVIEANVIIGVTQSEAIAYSSIRNPIINGTLISSIDGVNTYNISTYTGFVTITDSGGIIYIDEAPPSVAYVPDSLYIQSKGTTKAAKFNGENSYIATNTTQSLPIDALTISGWVYIAGFNSSSGAPEWWTDALDQPYIGLKAVPNAYPSYSSGAFVLVLKNATGTNSTCSVPANINKWYFVTEVVNGSKANLSINAGAEGCGFSYRNPSGLIASPDIGTYAPDYIGPGNVIYGDITNLQVYDKPLSPNQIRSLYYAGVAASPISQNSLYGWWPLDGSPDSFVGNGNNGISYNVSYAEVNEEKAHVSYTNGGSAPSALVGFVTNSGFDSVEPSYLQPNGMHDFVTARTDQNGNVTLFTMSNGSVSNLNGTAYLFNGNSSTVGNLVGWWPLELGHGKKAYDFSGYYNNGNFSSGKWLPYEETVTNLMVGEFDGSSSYLHYNTSNNETDSISISAWINNTGEGSYPQNIAAVTGLPRSQQVFGIGVESANGPAVARWNNVADTLTGSEAPSPSGGVITPGKPYLVTGVWNAANNSILLYVNGEVVAKSTANGTDLVWIKQVNIGGLLSGMGTFNGSLSDVQVYNTALPQTYVEQLYHEGLAGGPLSDVGLVGWWPLDGSPHDYAINNYTLASNSVYFKNIAFINAFVNSTLNVAGFSGVGNSIIDRKPRMPTSTPIAIAAWIRPASYQNSKYGEGSIAGWGSGKLNTTALIVSNNGQISVLGGQYSCSVGLYAKPNIWSFVALSMESNVATVYLDGINESCTLAAAPVPTSYNLSIGSLNGTMDFNGSIANVQIYNSTLSPYQVKQLYIEGLPVISRFGISFG